MTYVDLILETIPRAVDNGFPLNLGISACNEERLTLDCIRIKNPFCRFRKKNMHIVAALKNATFFVITP